MMTIGERLGALEEAVRELSREIRAMREEKAGSAEKTAEPAPAKSTAKTARKTK